MCGLGLESPMHALMTSVLLRLAGLDEFGRDVQLDPPDGELRESSDRVGRERVPVVGADPVWEPVLSEEPSKAPDRGVEIEPSQGATLKQEAGVAVLDGERLTQGSVAHAELAFEVGGPGGVGSVHGGEGRPGMLASAAGPFLPHQTVTVEDTVNGVLGRRMAELAGQYRPQLLGPPAAAFAELEDALHDRLGCSVR
jgi:hypothetical protein